MSFKSESSSNYEKILPSWMVNKLLAKNRRNAPDEAQNDHHATEERKRRPSRSDSMREEDLPLIEHRRDTDGGNALRISMNTKLATKTYTPNPVELERIKKITPPGTTKPRMPIAYYMPTGAVQAADPERSREESRSAKIGFRQPTKIEGPKQERQLRSVGIAERKINRSSRIFSPPRTLPKEDIVPEAKTSISPFSSKAPSPGPTQTYSIPRPPRHVPRLPSISELPVAQRSSSSQEHRAEPQHIHQSYNATEWGFVTGEPTSFLESPSDTDESETSASHYTGTSDGLGGMPDVQIHAILARNRAIGRGATRNQSEHSPTTDGRPKRRTLPEANAVIGLGVFENGSESEYSEIGHLAEVERRVVLPVIMDTDGLDLHENEDYRSERWKRYFDVATPRRPTTGVVDEEVIQDLLFEQLLQEVQNNPQEPGYRSEAQRREYWDDIRKMLRMDSSDEEEDGKQKKDIEVPKQLPESPSRQREQRAREQQNNRRATMYQANTQQNTFGIEARDTIGSVEDLWELETLLKNLQKKRKGRSDRCGHSGDEGPAVGDGVVEKKSLFSKEYQSSRSNKYAKSSIPSSQAPYSSSSPSTHSQWTLSQQSQQSANSSNFTTSSSTHANANKQYFPEFAPFPINLPTRNAS